MRNAQPLPRLEFPTVVEVVSVPSTTADISEDVIAGIESLETESPSEDIENVIVPTITLDMGYEEVELPQQAPEAIAAEADLTPEHVHEFPGTVQQVDRLEEPDIAEFLRYRRPTPVNRTPAEILRGPADDGERERVIPTESPLPHWETPEREPNLLAVPGNIGVDHLRARPESPSGYSEDHLQARDALTVAVQQIRSASTSPDVVNAMALVRRSSPAVGRRRSVSPVSPRLRSSSGLRRL
ncbi:hypothetical protein BZA77DRAFT_299779 [Pyronema omphalodes]|nr:hypothetical protein BZA77DRAFT_299779 [Pyronema omphalodes]